MKNLKLVTVLFLGLTLLFASCKKNDNNTDDPIPPAAAKKLMKYSVDGGFFKFAYDGDKLSKMEINSGGSIENSIDFNYSADNLISIVVKDGGDIEATIVFAGYNYSGLPSKAYVLSGTNNDTMSSFEYTYSGGKLMTVKLFNMENVPAKLASEVDLVYLDNNFVKSVEYVYNNGTKMLVRINNYVFDDKKNPGLTLGQFEFNGDRFISYLSVMDKNNYTKHTSVNANGDVLGMESYNKVFEYDSEGYPTKCTMTSFEGNKVKILKYEY